MNKPFRENPDNHFDTEARFNALKNAEKNHQEKMKQERMGIPDFEQSMVSDYIRNRIDTRMSKPPEKPRKSPEAKEYDRQYRKLKKLKPEELKQLLEEAEEESKEGCGLSSKGPLMKGYAIDVKTLRSKEDTKHDQPKYDLEKIILQEEEIYDQEIIKRRIIKGYIYLRVSGFSIPIVVLYFPITQRQSDNQIIKIISHIKNEKKLLPINYQDLLTPEDKQDLENF